LLADIFPEPRERIFVCGKTDSGKTTLVRQLVRAFPYVVAFDAKRMLGMDSTGKRRVDWLEFTRVTSWRAYEKLIEKRPGDSQKIIYVPTPRELRDDKCVNAFFESIYYRRNCVAYIDELTSVVQRTRIPDFYFDCLVRGRELNIGMWQSSQRPKDIPPSVVDSSERYYIFKLKFPADVKRVFELTGLNENLVELPKRQFFYVTEEGERRGPLTLDFGG